MKIPDINEKEIEILAMAICSLAVAFGYNVDTHLSAAETIMNKVKFILTRAVEEFQDTEERLEGGEQ